MVGKPYNGTFMNKKSPESAYCSQLIWQAYYTQSNRAGTWRDWGLQNGGGAVHGAFRNRVDLDSDGGPIVWPNDILNHIDILQFNASVPDFERYEYYYYDYRNPFSS